MSTSGTYAFSPSTADLIEVAFARCGMRRTQVLTEHYADATNEANLMLADWSTRPGPNWWATDTVSQLLTEGTATYALAATTIMPVAVYISTTDGGQTNDRIIAPLSSYQYASLPSKAEEGAPTSYWFNRLTTPEITLWPVPDDTATYTLKIRRWRQLQDTSVPSGSQPEVPWRFLDAFAWELAARMAWIYAPDRVDKLEIKAKMVWDRAATNDMEQVPIHITPSLSGYFQ